MKPAAIYARSSTELQNEKSTEDQIALCQSYAARHQLDIVATFEDKARSGASVFGRDGLMQLMDAARQNRFSVVIVEALDRLSRDMEDPLYQDRQRACRDDGRPRRRRGRPRTLGGRFQGARSQCHRPPEGTTARLRGRGEGKASRVSGRRTKRSRPDLIDGVAVNRGDDDQHYPFRDGPRRGSARAQSE